MKAELEECEARPDAEQGRARRGVPLIQSEARGERVETIGNTKEVEEESYESREEGSRLLAMRGEGPRGREAEAQARVVCRACASKVFSSARASVVCLVRASEDFFARASLVCRARASLLLRPARLARVYGGCRAIQENVLMTVAPPSRASSMSPGLGGRPGGACWEGVVRGGMRGRPGGSVKGRRDLVAHAHRRQTRDKIYRCLKDV